MNTKCPFTSASFFKVASLLLGIVVVLPLRAAPIDSNPIFAPRSAATELQLVVAMPASLSLIGQDNVSGVLTSLVENVFQQSGFLGHLIVVPSGEPAQGGIPTLEIYLLDWRITGAGNVDCTFIATLTIANGSEESLGLFDGTSLPMFGLRDAFNRAEAFDQAATDAIDILYGDIREKNLLPASILN